MQYKCKVLFNLHSDGKFKRAYLKLSVSLENKLFLLKEIFSAIIFWSAIAVCISVVIFFCPSYHEGGENWNYGVQLFAGDSSESVASCGRRPETLQGKVDSSFSMRTFAICNTLMTVDYRYILFNDRYYIFFLMKLIYL